MLPVLRSTAMCNLRHAAALAVCGRFQHESSSPCYRSSGGWVECLRLSGIRSFLRSSLERRHSVSSPGSRYRAREARRSSARSLRFGGRRLVHHADNQARFQSPCLNRPVDRQAYQSCRPSSSRLPPRQTRPSNRLGAQPFVVFRPVANGTSSASRACTGCAWDTSWSNIPRPPP